MPTLELDSIRVSHQVLAGYGTEKREIKKM